MEELQAASQQRAYDAPTKPRSCRYAAASHRLLRPAPAIALGALIPAVGIAQVAPTSLPGAAGWHYTASVYAYLPSVSGSSSFPADSGGTSLNLSADQILDKLKFVAMGTFGAHNGSWGVFTDAMYLNFGGSRSNSRDFTIGNIGLPADASGSFDWGLKGWVWTLAGEYRLASEPSFTIDLLAGTRLLDLRERLTWNIAGSIGPLDPVARSGETKVSESTWDAIVGVKGRYGFGANRQWAVPFYLDVGTGQSNSTVQAAAGLGYAFKWGEVTAMWRYLGYHPKAGKDIQDISFSGPLIGATFRW